MQGMPRLCQLRAGNKQEAALDAPVSPLPGCGRHVNCVRLIEGSTAQHLSLLKAFLRDSKRNAQLPWPANGPDFALSKLPSMTAKETHSFLGRPMDQTLLIRPAGWQCCMRRPHLPVRCSTTALHHPSHSFLQRYLHASPRPIRCGRAPVSLRPGLELPKWTPYPTGDSFTAAAAMFLRTSGGAAKLL